jgi:type IV pilus assembly protein PilA
MKKGLTLIELLIVVAIIRILAGVGIPMYNGYMAEAKINASKANHSNIINFAAAALAKCAYGSA